MPLDFSLLLSSSPPTYLPLEAHFDCIDTEPPFACRRVASFPMVNRHFPKPSSLKCRSMSETGIANGHGTLNGLTLQDFKRELTALLEEETNNDKCKRRTSEPTTPDDPEQQQRKSPCSKCKKKVSFADDCGRELFSVRQMTEASDVPPKLTSPVVRAILGVDEFAVDTEARPSAQWTLDFAQPASEYMAFREKVDANSVALENVVIKNDSCRLAGTIKVKNLSFDKEVFIRCTENGWRSYNDRQCRFMISKARNADVYDTFQFDFEIPCDDDAHEVIEFCICFRASEGREYWDSNDGKNFRVVSEKYRLKMNHSQPTTGAGHTPKKQRSPPPGKTDVFQMDLPNWSEFSSWSDLSTEGPYW